MSAAGEEAPLMSEEWVTTHADRNRLLRLAPVHLRCLQHFLGHFQPIVALGMSFVKALVLVWRKPCDVNGYARQGVDSLQTLQLDPLIWWHWSAKHLPELGLARQWIDSYKVLTPHGGGWTPRCITILVEQSIKHQWVDVFHLLLRRVDLIKLWSDDAIPRGVPPLVHLACASDAPSVLRLLLGEYNRKWGMNRVKEEVNRPLNEAHWYDHARYEIEVLINPESGNLETQQYYLSPMTFCAFGNSKDCAQLLFDNGSDDWSSTDMDLVLEGETSEPEHLVWLAASDGNEEMVKMLAEFGVTLRITHEVVEFIESSDAYDPSHPRALEILQKYFGHQFVQLLNVFDENKRNTPFLAQVASYLPAGLKRLFTETNYLEVAQPSQQVWDLALRGAVSVNENYDRSDCIEGLKCILQHGTPTLDQVNWTNLTYDIKEEHATLLLEKFGPDQLIEAMRSQLVELMEHRREGGYYDSWCGRHHDELMNRRYYRRFYMWWACRHGVTKVVKFLLEIFVDEGDGSDSDRRSLNWIQKQRHQILQERGKRDRDGELDDANGAVGDDFVCMPPTGNNKEMTQEASVDDDNELHGDSWSGGFVGLHTALMLACKKGHLEIVKLFCADGRVDINDEDHDGRTPAMLASRYRHVEVAKLLVGHHGWCEFGPEYRGGTLDGNDGELVDLNGEGY